MALCFLALYILYFCIRVALNQADGPKGDWGVFYRAGLAMRQQTPLYSLDDGPLLTFKYAPCVALALIWMTWFPVTVSRVIWMIGDVLMLAFVVVATWRLASIDSIGRHRVWIPISLACIACVNYQTNQFHAGQVTCAVLFLVTLAYCLLWSDRPVLAGAVLAPAVCLKVVPICFVPLFLLKKRWLTGAASFTVALVALLLLPAFWVGWAANLELLTTWPRHIASTNVPMQLYRPQNLSILGLLVRALGGYGHGGGLASMSLDTIRAIWLSISIATAAAIYAWCWRSIRKPAVPFSEIRCLVVLLMFMVLFNPLAWRYNFITLLVPLVVIFATFEAEGWRPPWLVTLLAVGIGLQYVTTRQTDVVPLLWLRDYGGRTIGAILILIVFLLVTRVRDRFVPESIGS